LQHETGLLNLPARVQRIFPTKNTDPVRDFPVSDPEIFGFSALWYYPGGNGIARDYNAGV